MDFPDGDCTMDASINGVAEDHGEDAPPAPVLEDLEDLSPVLTDMNGGAAHDRGLDSDWVSRGPSVCCQPCVFVCPRVCGRIHPSSCV